MESAWFALINSMSTTPNHISKRVMKGTQNVLYGVFILLLLAIAGLFLASLMPIPGNVKIKIVKSGSMEPAIRTGSIVVIKPSPVYTIGEIITFGEDTRLAIPTTHRIVAIRQADGVTYFSTKGDANEEADPKETKSSDVIGRVLISVPYAGFVLDFAKKPVGFSLLIALPAALIILDELFAIWGEVKKFRARKRGNEKSAIRDEGEESTNVWPRVVDLRNGNGSSSLFQESHNPRRIQ